MKLGDGKLDMVSRKFLLLVLGVFFVIAVAFSRALARNAMAEFRRQQSIEDAGANK
ncbi:MAG: hypothetical protein WCI55_14480 [Armatimonadota bacterium]